MIYQNLRSLLLKCLHRSQKTITVEKESGSITDHVQTYRKKAESAEDSAALIEGINQ